MSTLPISVVIPTKNAERTIEDCLVSVQRNNPAEIIVVDGNSTDRTLDITRRYTNIIYSDQGRGINYARQMGTEKATSEYVAYIDSDVVLTEDALATMLRSLENSVYVYVNAQIALDMKCSGYWEWAQYQQDLLSMCHGIRKDYMCTMAGLVRKRTILKYKFDTSERYLDDTDFELRLRKAGYKFSNAPAFFYNHYRTDLKSFVKRRFFYGQMATRYLQKYGLWHVRFWPPLFDAYWMGFCLIKGKPKLLLYFMIDAVVETIGMAAGLLRTDWKIVPKGNGVRI